MISIYSVHFNNLDFLSLQYKQFNKYCINEYRLIIINNGINESFVKEIHQFCKEYKLEEIVPIFSIEFDKNRMLAMDHARALKYTYEHYICKDESDLRIVIDSDIFPFRKFDFFDIIKDGQIAGIRLTNSVPYASSFLILYNKDVNLTNINIPTDFWGDSGFWTFDLVQKYKVTWINHTCPMRKEEVDYIFQNADKDVIQCDDNFWIQIISNNFLHYYQGSRWNNHDDNYHNKKFKFIKYFLSNIDKYNITLDSNVHYQDAHMDQWINKDKYPLYKIIKHE